MVLGVPGVRDRGCVGRNWEEKNDAVLVRAREEKGALHQPGHIADDVAADWGLGGAWQERGRSSARGKGQRGARARRVEGHGEQEVACGPPSTAGGALTGGKGKQRGREEEDNRLDLFANSKKFRGPTVK